MSKKPLPASLADIDIKPVPEDQPPPAESLASPPARAGRVALTLRIEPELHRKLRTRAFAEDTTIQDIILEALRRMGI